MSARTVADIEEDIAAVKLANPKWLYNSVDKALITAYTNEKISLQTPPTIGEISSSICFHSFKQFFITRYVL